MCGKLEGGQEEECSFSWSLRTPSVSFIVAFPLVNLPLLPVETVNPLQEDELLHGLGSADMRETARAFAGSVPLALLGNGRG